MSVMPTILVDNVTVEWLQSKPLAHTCLCKVTCHPALQFIQLFKMQPATLLLKFTTLIASFLATPGSCFQQKKNPKKPPVRYLSSTKPPTGKVEYLTAVESDKSFRNWWRPKKSYWTYIYQVTRNKTPNKCYCSSVTAGCLSRQQCANTVCFPCHL